MVNRSRSITERRSACAWRRSSVSRWSSTFARSNSSRATHTSARARADGGKIISISARRRESDSRGPEDHTPDQAPGGMSAPDAGAVRANPLHAPQHFLCFLPLPHGQGSFLPILGFGRLIWGDAASCAGQVALGENLDGAVGSTWSALLEARPPSHLLRHVLHQPSMGITIFLRDLFLSSAMNDPRSAVTL